MQVDMHYYGVYALARSSGLKSEIAKRIAEASQFVDDYTEEKHIETKDGGLISYWPSGHGMVCDANFDPMDKDTADPHKVWVPFHFLPGGEGDAYEDRMRCRKDGSLAQAALKRVLDKKDEQFAPELVGIIAHVYADTFSHYGFSGLRNDGNLVDAKTIELDVKNDDIKKYLLDKAAGFFNTLVGKTAGDFTRGLGHSSVADFPDRPFLRWEFKYEDGTPSPKRDNQATYLEACEKLFNFFSDFKLKVPQYAEDDKQYSFDNIRSTIQNILAYEGKKEERSNQWQEAASKGSFLFKDAIPAYSDAINNEISDAANGTVDNVKNSRIWFLSWSGKIGQ